MCTCTHRIQLAPKGLLSSRVLVVIAGTPQHACFGHQVQRPISARRMKGFKDVCGGDLPPMPDTAIRERDLVLKETGVYLDNVLARGGI